MEKHDRTLKRKMKKLFVLKMPPWDRRLMVVVGMKKKETLEGIKRYRFRKTIYKLVEEDKDFDNSRDEAYTYFDKKTGLFFLYLYNWKDNDYHKAILVHEVAHIVKDMLAFIGAENEDEATGYTNQWLWHKIVKRLK